MNGKIIYTRMAITAIAILHYITNLLILLPYSNYTYPEFSRFIILLDGISPILYLSSPWYGILLVLFTSIMNFILIGFKAVFIIFLFKGMKYESVIPFQDTAFIVSAICSTLFSLYEIITMFAGHLKIAKGKQLKL